MAETTPAHPATMAAELQNSTTATDSPLPAPIITTSRLHIRAMHPQDAPSMAHHAGPASITKYMSLAFQHPYLLSHAQDWIALNAKDRLDNYVLTLHADPTDTIGGIGLKLGRDVSSHTGEVGYWIGEEHQGSGLMSEALFAFTAWVFGPQGVMNDGRRLSRVFAEVFSGNTSSMRVLERNGYMAEGVRKGHVEKHGVVYDLHSFGVTKADWEEWRRSEGK